MGHITTGLGSRASAEEEYRGHTIEVHSTSAREAGCHLHVYITGPTGIRVKADIEGMAETQDQGYQYAFIMAKRLLDDVGE
jgi:hypothetical protein